MNRRKISIGIGATAVTLAWAARAQTPAPIGNYRVGYLSLGSPTAEATRFDAFRAGLAALGYVEGRNLTIEARWLDGGKYDRLQALARELADLPVDVIVTYATPGVTAAKQATTTIPIVFATVGDAVAVGLVASLGRPGGNVTGTSYFIAELVAKRLALLAETLPNLKRVGFFYNTANKSAETVLASLRQAAAPLNVEVVDFGVADAAGLPKAFADMAGAGLKGVVVPEDPMLIYSSKTIADLALQHRIASCGVSEFAQAGGMMAYGIDFVEMWRRAALFVDKILKGAKPADIPVEQATKFELVLNLKTANELGIGFPLSVIGRADSVVE